MGLHLIYSRSSRAAKNEIYGKIKELVSNRQKCFLIVPESAVLQAEQRFFQTLPASANLYLEILTFRRLPNIIHRKCGKVSGDFIGESGKAILTALALEECMPILLKYSGFVKNPGFILSMSNYISKLKSMELSSEMLMKASNAAKQSGDMKISEKLFDIASVYSDYDARLQDGHDDDGNRMEAAAKRLSEVDFFENSTVFADGFSGFTKVEYSILTSIMKQAENTYITLPCKKSDSDIYEKPLATANALKRIANTHSVKIAALTELSEDNVPQDLAFLRDDFFTSSQKLESSKNVKLYSVCDEAEAAAMLVLNLCKDGYSMRDIALCAANAESYAGTLDSVFEKHGIPLYMSVKTDFSSLPLYKLISASFSAILKGFRREDMTAILKSSLSNVTEELADSLDLYAKTWDISGNIWASEKDFQFNPDGFGSRITQRGEKILSDANKAKKELMRPLLNLKEKLTVCKTAKDYATATLEYLEELSVSRKLEKYAEFLSAHKDRYLASCNLQLWKLLCNTLDSLNLLCGSKELSAEEFVFLLLLAFESSKLTAIPGYIDDVQLIPVSQISGYTPKVLIILGANENIFPKPNESDAFFSRPELSLFKSYGLDLGVDTEPFECETLREFQSAVSLPSEKLFIIRNESKPASVGMSRIASLLSKDELSQSDIPIVGKEAAYDYYASHGMLEYLPEDIKNSLSLCAKNSDCSISEDVSGKVFGKNMMLSPSVAEEFADCKLACWCNRFLKLRVEEKAELEPRSIGTYAHSILEEFILRLMESGVEFSSISKDEIRVYIKEFVKEYVDENLGGMEGKSSRFKYLLSRLEINFEMFILNMTKDLAQSKFKPWKAECKIGSTERGDEVDGLTVTLSDGRKLTVKGSADRVDIYRKDGKSYIKVADYKTGGKVFSVNGVSLGHCVQMPMYLFSICQNAKDGDNELVPAAILYYPVARPNLKTSSYSENINDDDIMKQYLPNGMVLCDDDVMKALEENIGEKKYIPVTFTKDGNISKNSDVFSGDEFEEIKKTVCEILIKTGEGLVHGQAEASGTENNPEKCKYCRYSSICRNEK